LAGKGSRLQRRHRVYIDHVGVANSPEDYQSRSVRVFPIWPKVHLWALEPHDLALTRLERSIDHDIRDVLDLAQAGRITRETLISRFATELEPHDAHDVGGCLLADYRARRLTYLLNPPKKNRRQIGRAHV